MQTPKLKTTAASLLATLALAAGACAQTGSMKGMPHNGATTHGAGAEPGGGRQAMNGVPHNSATSGGMMGGSMTGG